MRARFNPGLIIASHRHGLCPRPGAGVIDVSRSLPMPTRPALQQGLLREAPTGRLRSLACSRPSQSPGPCCGMLQ